MIGSTIYLVCKAESKEKFITLDRIISSHFTLEKAIARRIDEEARTSIPHFITETTLEK